MPERNVISTDRAPVAVGAYSQAIRTGDLVFTAGQLGIDPASGEFSAPDVAGQAEQALANLSAILDASGSGLDRLVKVTVFLADIADWPALNDVFELVRQAGGTPRLTGSGSTVFALTADPERAAAVAGHLRDAGVRVTLTRTRDAAASIERVIEEED